MASPIFNQIPIHRGTMWTPLFPTPISSSLPPPELHPDSSLYVGDLDSRVHETHLFDLFKQVASVFSVKVCRDNHRSLGYGYVNFFSPESAIKAMEVLNYTPIFNKQIRIMRSNYNPTTRLSNKANIFIKNLHSSIDNKTLKDTFSKFGTILSCKLAIDNTTSQSKGFGFIQFDNNESAQTAIDDLNGTVLNEKQVYVGYFIPRKERIRDDSSSVSTFTNVYVKNLPKEISLEDFKKRFDKFGVISSAIVMIDQSGNSRGFGFVNFESSEAAASAVEEMNGVSLGDDVLYVGKALKKLEREEEVRKKFEEEKISWYEKMKGVNLYVKNLDNDINDEKLKEMFSVFGNVTSCKVMVNVHGMSKGFGFVAYSSSEQASKAIREMNGKMIGKKPLYVCLAQRKEERRARLQAMFSRFCSSVSTAPIPAPMSGYHQPVMDTQNPYMYVPQNVSIPQPIGYRYQPQFIPWMHYPHQKQYQTGPHNGFRHCCKKNNHFKHHQKQPNMNHSNERNGIEGSSPVLSISELTSSLASASPDDQIKMLGTHLYPLVERYEPVHVSKVTGMLLEMEQEEILKLIKSPDALKSKVEEAVDVLKRSSVDVLSEKE